MNANIIKPLLVAIMGMICAVLLGTMLASGDFTSMLLLSYLALGMYIVAIPGYMPLIAIGLLSPFILPVPFISSFPFLIIMLGVCGFRYFFENALNRRTSESYRHCLTIPIILFFAWVIFRYLKNPVMPNLSGFGQNVTGFRSYLNYGLCLVIVLALPRFLDRREEAQRLLRWMTGISIFFVIFFIPFIFTKSESVAMWLRAFGLFVTYFDNGWLRFVVLPSFGVFLLTLTLLPNICRVSNGARVGMAALGFAAVVMGGNRSSVVMLLASVMTILMVKRQFARLLVLLTTVGMLTVTLYYIAETANTSGGIGFMRLTSLFNRRIAEQTDAASNMEWRQVRWNRAIAEIKRDPFLGKGYGGIENAWIEGFFTRTEDAQIDIDLATGGTHNGYLSSAYSLGIPCTLLFLAVMLSGIWRGATQSRACQTSDIYLSEYQLFVVANLVSYLPSIFIGTDINAPIIWFYITMGIIFQRTPLYSTTPSVLASAMPPISIAYRKRQLEKLPTGS